MNITMFDRKTQMKKMGSFVQFSCFLPELWSLNSKKGAYFCNFVLTSARSLKSIKAIYIYASERSRYVLSENGIVYYAMTYCFGDIGV